jgi:hypothetical protein
MRVLLVAWLLASSLTPRPLAERARQADRVAVVQVLAVRTELVGGDVHKMLTHTDVLVGETLKGPTGIVNERLTITQLGGRSGLWEAHVPGDASFAIGETALVLLKCGPTPDRCGLVGLNEGKVTFVGDSALLFNLKRNEYTRRPVADVLADVRTSLAAASSPAGSTPPVPSAVSGAKP